MPLRAGDGNNGTLFKKRVSAGPRRLSSVDLGDWPIACAQALPETS